MTGTTPHDPGRARHHPEKAAQPGPSEPHPRETLAEKVRRLLRVERPGSPPGANGSGGGRDGT